MSINSQPIKFRKTAENQDLTDVGSLFIKYFSSWPIFVTAIFVFLTAALIYLYYSPPQYRISSTLLLRDEGKNDASFNHNTILSDLEAFQSSKKVENEMEFFKSIWVMQKMISELSLQTGFHTQDDFGKTEELYGKEVPVKILIHDYDTLLNDNNYTVKIGINDKGYEMENQDQEVTFHQFGERFRNKYGEFSIEENDNTLAVDNKPFYLTFKNLAREAESYQKKLEVQIAKINSNILTISLEESKVQKGTDIIAELINLYNKEALKEKNDLASNTLEFIDNQLIELIAEINEIETESENYKIENNITDLDSEAKFYVENINNYTKQLTEYNNQLEVVETLKNHILEQEGIYQIVPGSLMENQANIESLIINFNDLQSDKEQKLISTQPNNPIIQNLDKKINTLRENILNNLTQIKQNIEISKKNFIQHSTQVETQGKKIPKAERELLGITRKLELKKNHYSYLIKKREEAMMSLSATSISNSKIISPPIAGTNPVKPHKLLVMAGAVLSGFLFPFAILYLKDSFSNTLKNKSELLLSKESVLGEISRVKQYQSAALYQNPKSVTAEQFRMIRTNYHLFTEDAENQAIMVTSSMSGEGKTFFSWNFGLSLSMLNKRVVILEFDLRKPALSKMLGMENKVGITNYLKSDDVSLQDIVKPSEASPNLSIVSSGDIIDDPDKIITGSSRIQQLILELRRDFDYIILDTAPIGQVTDAFNLAKFCDKTIYILRYNYTSRTSMGIIQDIENNKNFKNPLIVFNDAKMHNTYGYSYA